MQILLQELVHVLLPHLGDRLRLIAVHRAQAVERTDLPVEDQLLALLPGDVLELYENWYRCTNSVPFRIQCWPQDGCRWMRGSQRDDGGCLGGGTVSLPRGAANSMGSSRARVAAQDLGGELEVAVAGPVAEDAEQVAQVRLGVEPVQLARGDEREEVGGGLGVVVAADEEPGFAGTTTLSCSSSDMRTQSTSRRWCTTSGR
jgi:hypothetical protein